jgi:hypothetical protein
MITILITVLIMVIAWIAIIVAIKRTDGDLSIIVLASVAWWLLGGMVAFGVDAVIISCGTGLLPNYSEGVREGFVTKVSEKGVIWKTYEGQIQVGTGDISALQPPFEYSLPKSNKIMQSRLIASLGKKVRITYRQWFVMPYSVGESGYELLTIEELE